MRSLAAAAIVATIASPAFAQAPNACRPSSAAAPAAAAPTSPAAGNDIQVVARTVHVSAIPGVVAEGASWRKLWQGPGNSADGPVRNADGSVLVAQEDYDAALRIGLDGSTSVAITGAKGVGSLSMDAAGRVFGAHRTERPGSTKPDKDQIVNAITQLAPERRTIADKWSDGAVLTVRPNDLTADAAGGVWFTSGCLYFADSRGVSVAADNLRTNGIVLSADGKTLFVTNGDRVVAFDVAGPGQVANRRDFAILEGGTGDGMALDSAGRLYVTSQPGVQVFDPAGKRLGLIPSVRAVIALGFAGPDRKTLVVVGSGAEDEAGKPIRTGPQQTAATVYALPLLASGPVARGK